MEVSEEEDTSEEMPKAATTPATAGRKKQTTKFNGKKVKTVVRSGVVDGVVVVGGVRPAVGGKAIASPCGRGRGTVPEPAPLPSRSCVLMLPL